MAFGAMAVLAASAVVSPAQAEDPPVGAACDDAVARGVWELAIDLCSPEILPAGASDAAKAHVLLGRSKAYEGTGDAERSAADAAEAQKLDPGAAAKLAAARAQSASAKGDLQKIEALWHSGQDERALGELDRVIALNPKSAQAYALRASIYLARKDNDRAQVDIKSATALAQNCELKAKQQTYVFTCP
jgi:tetratricopeptide (TPR) repeat protein